MNMPFYKFPHRSLIQSYIRISPNFPRLYDRQIFRSLNYLANRKSDGKDELCLTHVFNLLLRRLFETFFAPINIWSFPRELHFRFEQKLYVCSCKCALCLSNFNPNQNCLIILTKFPIPRFKNVCPTVYEPILGYWQTMNCLHLDESNNVLWGPRCWVFLSTVTGQVPTSFESHSSHLGLWRTAHWNSCGTVLWREPQIQECR
jgi:hypothetical protein